MASKAVIGSTPAGAVRVAPARRRQQVVAAAGKGKQPAPRQAPSDIVLGALGVLAAANMAVATPALAADLVPDSAKSSAARAEVNRETSSAPSIKDVGNALSKQNFQTNDPKEVGKALDRNTPDVDLTKNPKDLAKDAGKNVQQRLPNLSEAPNPFDKGGASIPLNDNLDDLRSRAAKTASAGAKKAKDAAAEAGEVAKEKGNKAGKKVNEVAGNVSLDIPNPFQDTAEKLQEGGSAGKPIQNVGSKQDKLDKQLPASEQGRGNTGGGAAQSKGNQAQQATQSVRKNVTGNLSASVTTDSEKLGRPLEVRDAEKSQGQFPSPTEFAKLDRGEAQSAAERFSGETGGNLPKAANLGKNVPNPGELTKKLPDVGLPDVDVKGAASKASAKAQETIDRVSLSNPFASGPEKAGQEAKSAAKDAGREASKVGAKVPSPSEVGDAAKAKGKEAARSAKEVTGNLSLSNPFASGPEKAAQDAKSAVKDAGREASKLGAKVPSPSEAGDAAKAKGKEAARGAKEVTGNLSFGEKSPLDKAQDAAKNAAKDVQKNLPKAGGNAGSQLPGSKTTARDLGIPKNA